MLSFTQNIPTQKPTGLLLIGFLAVSCSSQTQEPTQDPPQPDPIHLVASASSDSVQGTLYDITCDNGSTLREYVPYGPNGLPEHISDTYSGQPFSDLFTVLPSGWCNITATAMRSPSEPEPSCTPAQARVEVTPNTTTELVLPITCSGASSGALDIAVIVNTIPSLTNDVPRDLEPQTTCTPLNLSFPASDPDGDFTTVTLSLTEQPPDAANVTFNTDSNGNLFFQSPTPGTYFVEVVISDGLIDISEFFEINLEGEALPSCD